MTTGRLSIRLDASRVARRFRRAEKRRRACRRLHRAWKAAERTLADHRQRVEETAREADYCVPRTRNCPAWSPEPGEEEILAEKRGAMMRAEKIAGDLSRLTTCCPARRHRCRRSPACCSRLERKAARGAGPAGRGQRSARSGARSLVRRAEPHRSGGQYQRVRSTRTGDPSRSGCSRCAPHRASIISRSTSFRRSP
jgi:hypothetical protein